MIIINSNNSNINYLHNDSECWYLEVGITTTILEYTIYKKQLVNWKHWHNKPIPEEIFLNWKGFGLFDKSFAIILELVYRGKYKETAFSTTIELLITVTGNSNNICTISVPTVNKIK